MLVGILAAGVEARFLIAKDRVEVLRGRVEHAVQASERQRPDQARVVLEHLLEMRDAPVLRRGIAKETAFDPVVSAASGHLLQRVDGHLAQLGLGPDLGLLQQQQKGVRLREFGSAAKSSVLGVVSVLHRFQDGVDDPVVELPSAAGAA